MAFTLVPPPIRVTDRVVRGLRGRRSVTRPAVTRPAAWAGFGRPQSDHEWPPGPCTVTRYRFDPTARSMTRSRPVPSSVMKAATSCHGPSDRNRCFTPRRSPGPSSPTVATSTSGRCGTTPAVPRARAMASSAARPRASSAMPGAESRPASRRTVRSVPVSKTVSRWADSSTGADDGSDPRMWPSTFPASSCRTSSRSAASRSCIHAARSASPKGGAGIATISSISASVRASISRISSRARRTRSSSSSRSTRSSPVTVPGPVRRGRCR